MRRHRSLFIILLILLLLTSNACSTGPKIKAPKEQHLNYQLPAAPASLDPGKLADPSGFQLAGAIFEGLVRLNPAGVVEKALAENWVIDESGTRYTFYLRDAQWANGEKITAFDVEYSWKRILAPQYNSPYAYLFFDIKNAEGFNRTQDPNYFGKKATSDEVGIRAENEKTLVVELAHANYAFIKKLIHPAFYPISQKELENGAALEGAAFTEAVKIIAGGPFKIVAVEENNKYELVKNERYWDKENVKLESMTWYIRDEHTAWQMFKEGTLDLLTNLPGEEIPQGLQKGNISTSPVLAHYFYLVNTAVKPLADVRVRQALSLALDRNKLVETGLQGGQKQARGFVPAGLPGWLNEGLMAASNPEEAKRLLAEAGYLGGNDFPALTILVNNQQEQIALAEYLQSQWNTALGIQVTIEPLEWQERVKRVQEGKYELAMAGWLADYPDAAAFLDKFLSGSGLNDTGWNTPAFDELVRQARAAQDEENYLKALSEAERILLEEMPVLPIFDYTTVYAAQKWVKDVYYPPAGPAVEFKWAVIETA